MNKHQWRDRVFSPDGPGNITTRAVLGALSKYAGADLVCWPSEETLAADLATDRKTVRRHLRTAEEAGWLIATRKGRGHNWNSWIYTLALPDNAGDESPTVGGNAGDESPTVSKNAGDLSPNAGDESPINTFKNTSTSSAPDEEEDRGGVDARPAENSTDDASTDGSAPTDSLGVSKRAPLDPDTWPEVERLPRERHGDATAHLVYPAEFEGVWHAYPATSWPERKADVYKVVRRLVRMDVEPFRIEAAADAYREDMEANEKTGTRFVQMAANFFSGEEWREYLGREPGSFQPKPTARPIRGLEQLQGRLP